MTKPKVVCVGIKQNNKTKASSNNNFHPCRNYTCLKNNGGLGIYPSIFLQDKTEHFSLLKEYQKVPVCHQKYKWHLKISQVAAERKSALNLKIHKKL